ncbi:MAG: phosphoribosylglycinamide formyltransferase [Thermoguttaceae bacterium]|nr:phosphoribosylglycinamide formyltransferase [Thermoguttaceae bacterium]
MSKKLRLAVLISGRGRTLKNLLDVIDRGELDAEICVVIASSKNSSGLQYAEKYNIPIAVVESSDYETTEDFSDEVFRPCFATGADYVVMAGYLKYLRIPHELKDRVLNIHPSLIPSFCGKGMYGRRVHEQVLAGGVKVTGCTVHFVDNEYDHGPIIVQKWVEVHDDDTIDTLSDRVLYECEFKAYPEALRYISEGRVQVVDLPNSDNRVVHILPESEAK